MILLRKLSQILTLAYLLKSIDETWYIDPHGRGLLIFAQNPDLLSVVPVAQAALILLLYGE